MNFGGIAVSYISDISFERLATRYTTERIIGMRFGIWCIVKLYCYVTFFGACLILIVDNYTRNLGIKIFSCRWVVGDVNMKSKLFLSHIIKLLICDPQNNIVH